MKPTPVQHLLAQEVYREHGTFLNGIRLKVTGVVVGTGSQPYQPVYDRCQRANEQKDFPALGVAAARILQTKAHRRPLQSRKVSSICIRSAYSFMMRFSAP